MAWLVEALDKRRHAREAFTCGKPDLDAYLKETARRAADSGTGRTWVAIDPDARPDARGRRPVLGYYTVSMHSIDVGILPAERRRGLPSTRVPAALVGRLAVERSCQGRGLGRILLLDALRRISRAANQVSAHAVVLDAIDADAKRFYERFGFLELSDDPLHLFLPLASIRELEL